MGSEEQIRKLIEGLDVVTMPRLVGALEHVLKACPEAQKLLELEPRIDVLIAAIRAHQKEERTKWLQA